MRSPRGDEVWLVLLGRFSARLFVDTGIVERLRVALGDRLVPVLLSADDRVDDWLPHLGERVLRRSDLDGAPGRMDRLLRALDERLARQIGPYPLALRFNERHGFLVERRAPGHPMPYLNESLTGRLPAWRLVERLAQRWTFSAHRHVDSRLRSLFRDRCGALVLASVQGTRVSPLMTAARRFGTPTVGYVASWDHTVGKGVVSPHLDRYIVQNRTMRDDLVRYHSIPPERISVCGWPVTDVFAERTPDDEYRALLRSIELDVTRPVILYAGNTPANAPTEGALVSRLQGWCRDRDVGLIVRPHPNDARYRERFGGSDDPGLHVQEPSYADIDVLATLLQHVDCVVANAGTVLLEALVNDRPAVCVLFDEGAVGERRAELNVTGHHYRELIASGAFHRAQSFDELTAGVERALADPGELAAERARVVAEVVGVVDGHAADRTASAIVDVVADAGSWRRRHRPRRVAASRSPRGRRR